MPQAVVPLSSVRHKDFRLTPRKHYAFAADQHICPIVLAEFASVAACYPIVFLKNKDGGHAPYAQLGLEKGRNLFTDKAGNWRGSYVPLVFQSFPFMLVETEDEDQYRVCIDEASELLSADDGDLLFDESGEKTDTIERITKRLAHTRAEHLKTSAFCAELTELRLLKQVRVAARSASGAVARVETLAIDKDKFTDLGDETALEWRRRGWLEMVNAYFTSRRQIINLVKIYDERNQTVPA